MLNEFINLFFESKSELRTGETLSGRRDGQLFSLKQPRNLLHVVLSIYAFVDSND